MKKFGLIVLTALLMACQKTPTISQSHSVNRTIMDEQGVANLTYRNIVKVQNFRATSDEIALCEQQGGKITQVGMAQADACVVVFADKDKVCNDGSQCQSGVCLAHPDIRKNKKVTGQCSRSNDIFGCNNLVENGKAQGTMCVD